MSKSIKQTLILEIIDSVTKQKQTKSFETTFTPTGEIISDTVIKVGLTAEAIAVGDASAQATITVHNADAVAVLTISESLADAPIASIQPGRFATLQLSTTPLAIVSTVANSLARIVVLDA